MARKISGPFNNVTIQTIGHMGSTSMYNDDFSKIVLDQMAIFSQSDELSAIAI